jgi:two-component system, NtrC family, sensor kinase
MQRERDSARIVAICNMVLRIVMTAIGDFSSLRGKVTSAYISLAIGMLVLGVFALLDLLFLQRQVTEGEVVSRIKDAVLEMRQAEKNLFLYGDSGALVRASDYAAISTDLIRKHQTALNKILSDGDMAGTIERLHIYQGRLNDWRTASLTEREGAQEEIRRLGQSILETAESLASLERHMLQTTIGKSQRFLLIFLLITGFVITVLGGRLRRVAVKPLKQLESRLMPIAKGHFNRLEPPTQDREFITFTDAFNRMLKELEIRQRRMLQTEKLASLGILAAGVAHELNNPLSNISSSCQLLLEEMDEAEPEQMKTWLQQIDKETIRGQAIVRLLLNFGSQRVFQKSPYPLADILDETQAMIGKLLIESEAHLSIKIPEGMVVNVDKQRMQQLFINLIQNALHAAGKGVHVRISALLCEKGVSKIPEGAEIAGNLKCATESEERFVEILVADDGPGIPKEILSNVFDPFFTTREPGQGVGLGLYIVQEIVREHDGCLAVASRPEKGTRVIVLLPIEDEENA